MNQVSSLAVLRPRNSETEALVREWLQIQNITDIEERLAALVGWKAKMFTWGQQKDLEEFSSQVQ